MLSIGLKRFLSVWYMGNHPVCCELWPFLKTYLYLKILHICLFASTHYNVCGLRRELPQAWLHLMNFCWLILVISNTQRKCCRCRWRILLRRNKSLWIQWNAWMFSRLNVVFCFVFFAVCRTKVHHGCAAQVEDPCKWRRNSAIPKVPVQVHRTSSSSSTSSEQKVCKLRPLPPSHPPYLWKWLLCWLSWLSWLAVKYF